MAEGAALLEELPATPDVVASATGSAFSSHAPALATVGAFAGSPQFSDRSHAIADYLVHKGFTGPDAALGAKGYLYQQLQHQVSLLAFMDCFRVIGWLTLAAVPLMLLVRSFTVSGKAPSAH